jgi:hypothetical protein
MRTVRRLHKTQQRGKHGSRLYTHLFDVRPVNVGVPSAGVSSGVQVQVLALRRRLQDVPVCVRTVYA